MDKYHQNSTPIVHLLGEVCFAGGAGIYSFSGELVIFSESLITGSDTSVDVGNGTADVASFIGVTSIFSLISARKARLFKSKFEGGSGGGNGMGATEGGSTSIGVTP